MNKLRELIGIQRKLEKQIAAAQQVDGETEDDRALLAAIMDRACDCVARILIEKAKITSSEDM